MRNYHDAWYTLFDERLDTKKYLFHYTTIENAVKILYGNSLKFSKISRANDTLESKPRIHIDSDQELFRNVIKYFREMNNECLQILCFTMDLDKKCTSEFSNELDDKERMTNFAGRGYSLPRMWAQYAANNRGICLVFDKQGLINLIKNSLRSFLLVYQPISYYNRFSTYKMSDDSIIQFLDRINKTKSSEQRTLWNIDFLKDNIDFVIYNYFSKLDDWIGENEFRFVAYGQDDYFVKYIDKALVGIVMGENIEPANERIIKSFCPETCELRKILFSYAGCQLHSVKEG